VTTVNWLTSALQRTLLDRSTSSASTLLSRVAFVLLSISQTRSSS
jgi:hypothetical protein